MDALPPERVRYGDKEIATILRRASELQRAAPTRPDPSGLTLADLEEIAVEAGIDVGHLRQAASEIRRSPDSSWQTRILGAPLLLRLERVIEGELPAEAFDMLVPILQSGTDGTGQASTVGKALTWTSTGGNNARRLQVLVHAQDGETLVRLEERSTDTAVGLHAGFVAGSFGGALPAGMAVAGAVGVLAGVGLGAAIVAGAWGVARALYRGLTARRRHRLEQVFGELVEIVRSRVGTAALTAGDDAPG